MLQGRQCSPLSQPLLQQWRRVLVPGGEDEETGICGVYYIAPSGEELRSMSDIHRYLYLRRPHDQLMSQLTFFNFTFEPEISVFTPTSLPFKNKLKLFIPDISYGVERIPIPCFNWLSDDTPQPFQYTATRTYEPNIPLCTQSEFMVHCGCEDCFSATCPCQRLTMEEMGSLKIPSSTMGYQYGRLQSHSTSALYECSQHCRCGSSCGNRVVQQGPQHRLAVYYTSNVGWGLMTLDDIPKGSFICCYIGHVYGEKEANEKGLLLGDHYFAELDYIEVMEQASAQLCEQELSESCSSEDSSLSSSDQYYLVKRQRCSNSVHSTDSLTYSTPPHSSTPSSLLMSHPSHSRFLFYNETHSYIIDAQATGNVARFSNHSCSPNMFVQNVFIDCHDPRFPHVAFFSNSNIKAGSPLTWDYQYVVGSVEGREVKCQCGELNCRGRLL